MLSAINKSSMTQVNISNAASLFLKEREDLLGLQFKYQGNDQETYSNAVEQWRQDSLLLDDTQFRNRLATDQWTEEKFREIITATMDPSQLPTALPETQHYNSIGIQELHDSLHLNRVIPLQDSASQKLIMAFRPFLLWAASRWDEAMANLHDIEQYVNTDAIRDKLISELADCLLQVGARTLVLELHVAKMLDELEGNTPEERFQSFVEQKLCNPDGLEFIYKEYPMLARTLMIRTRFIVEAVLEAVIRFKSDYHEITKVLNLPSEKNKLHTFSAGMGDAHQQGRSVMRLGLENGTELMYKPKPLAASLHFSQLLSWMNEKGFTPSFKPLVVLDKGDYGWEECILTASCLTESEISRYYQRLGGLLAILHNTRGTDFHMENVIAAGEHPVPIDLETIFHNTPTIHFPDTADVVAKKKIVDSVIGTGLLPLLLYQNEEGFGVELSGMNGAGEQPLPFPVLQVENEDTDEMRFVRKEKSFGSSNNKPKLRGQDAYASDYVDDIVLGFKLACSILQLNLVDLMDASNGPLASFKKDTIRIILRPTQFYANFLMESHHPNYTKDALEREKLLDRLWYTMLDERVIASEREDILLGDIPYFVTTPNSCNLYDSRGHEIPNFFARPSYDLTIDRLKALDEREIERQSDWIISSILSTAEWNTSKSDCCSISGQSNAVQYANRDETNPEEDIKKYTDEYIHQAAEIGDYLLEQAIFNKNRSDATWIGVGMNYRGQWNVSAMKGGLYDGTAGPALFLAYLGLLTNEKSYTETAQLAMQTSFASLPYHANFSSAFYGQASILYTMSHFIRLGIADHSWIDAQNQLVSHLGNIVANDHCYDFLGGAAGVIPVLIQIYKQFGNEEALDIAIKYGNHLLSQAISTDSGTGWPSLLQTRQPLGGFAHGTAGISFALQLLSEESKLIKFHEYAEHALTFERSLFSDKHGNWADLRKEKHARYQSKYWCHGSTGIGLGRLLMYNTQEMDQPTLLAEIDTAVSATLNGGVGASHCLCHGDMGISELLLQYGTKLNQPDQIQMAYQIANQMINEKKEHGAYRTGIPRGLKTAGLFLGYSGIGYQLLRLADPKQVPSVLSLEISPGTW